jgi:hypothetical protein
MVVPYGLGTCYFVEVDRRSSIADAQKVAGAVPVIEQTPEQVAIVDLTGPVPGGSGELLDAPGEVEIGLCESSLGVGGELQADLVPAVDQDVGVMVCPLGLRSGAVDEGDRLGEVGEGELAHDRLALATPGAVAQAFLDLLV